MPGRPHSVSPTIWSFCHVIYVHYFLASLRAFVLWSHSRPCRWNRSYRRTIHSSWQTTSIGVTIYNYYELSWPLFIMYFSWNSWNAYSCSMFDHSASDVAGSNQFATELDITEAKVLAAANQMVSLGLKDAGYQYINIDVGPSLFSGKLEI